MSCAKSSMIIFFLYFLISFIYCKNASEWRSRSIYQMLTDRFSPTNFSYTRCVEQPMSENASRTYCGGTYKGAIDQLDYITQMGFNALWISPIPSNVDIETIDGVGWDGYWQKYIYELNNHFGTEGDLIEFITEAHKRDIWIMLDVVANHVGPNFTNVYFPFNKSEYFHQPLCFIEQLGVNKFHCLI
jgi:alpha-amylase